MPKLKSGADLQSQRALIALRRIIRATDLHSKRVRRESGLTVPQVVLLKAIEALGEVSGRTLAEEVSLSQSTVSTILDRLESRGFVERYRSPSDRRVVHVRLTVLGRQTVERAPALLHVRFVEALEQLPMREQKTILESLERVAEMMGAESVDAAPLLDVQASPADGLTNGYAIVDAHDSGARES
jgi:DNA-binding MarR family transcriptional regulator